VRRGTRHPILDFLDAGIPVALCTDNTTLSRTDQSTENLLLARDLPIDAIARIHREAAGRTFIHRPD